MGNEMIRGATFLWCVAKAQKTDVNDEPEDSHTDASDW